MVLSSYKIVEAQKSVSTLIARSNRSGLLHGRHLMIYTLLEKSFTLFDCACKRNCCRYFLEICEKFFIFISCVKSLPEFLSDKQRSYIYLWNKNWNKLFGLFYTYVFCCRWKTWSDNGFFFAAPFANIVRDFF